MSESLAGPAAGEQQWRLHQGFLVRGWWRRRCHVSISAALARQVVGRGKVTLSPWPLTPLLVPPCPLPVLAWQSQGQSHREGTPCYAIQRCAFASSMPLFLLKGETTQLLLPKTRQQHRLKDHLKKQGRSWQRLHRGAMGLKLSEQKEGPEGGVSGWGLHSEGKRCPGLWWAHGAWSKGRGNFFCSRG